MTVLLPPVKDQSNPIIIKPKTKSSRPKEFDNWPKLDLKGKWNTDLSWGGLNDSEWY